MPPALIPQPTRLTTHDGMFMLNHNVHVRSNAGAQDSVAMLRAALLAATGLDLPDAVSYTHLDVYKRQAHYQPMC